MATLPSIPALDAGAIQGAAYGFQRGIKIGRTGKVASHQEAAEASASGMVWLARITLSGSTADLMRRSRS